MNRTTSTSDLVNIPIVEHLVSNDKRFISFAVLLSLIILVFDMVIPLGFAGGVPYVAVVLLTFWHPRRLYSIIFGISSSALTILGFYLSPEGSAVWIVLLNRILALFGIWAAVIFANAYRSAFNKKVIAEQKIRRTERFLQRLHEITSNQSSAFDSKMRRILELGIEEYNLSIGMISKIEGEEYLIEHLVRPTRFESRFAVGNVFELAHTYCAGTMEGEGVKSMEHVSNSEWHNHTYLTDSQLESYIGVKIMVSDKVYGTLCFLCSEPREIPFTTTDREILVLMAEWIGELIHGADLESEMTKVQDSLAKEVIERTEELNRALLNSKSLNRELQREIEIRIEKEEEIKSLLYKEQELNRLKSGFVSLASHEFKTPLTSILSSVSIIEKLSEPADELKRNKFIGFIKSSVGNLTNILNDFLSTDRLESVRIPCKPKNFELLKLVNEVILEMEGIRKKGQSTSIKCVDLEIELFQDERLMRNILTNLLSNAYKYSKDEDEVIIEIISGIHDITINIIDQGIGIPKRDQKYMFDRFFRAGNVSGTGGTGLGLYIVGKYVSLINGKISFSSSENRGSTFTCNFQKNYKA